MFERLLDRWRHFSDTHCWPFHHDFVFLSGGMLGTTYRCARCDKPRLHIYV